ncbi:hypothetical protein A3Q56_01333 [Intoshia linei]|uniref:EGF-like domain-containing protein n=1 Tax=Intoshia linei TaxID=1819745 RepID=A0A177B9C3_9BILA|nr:hypothetical protein A3Q56_01333 [Intoshia linei]
MGQVNLNQKKSDRNDENHPQKLKIFQNFTPMHACVQNIHWNDANLLNNSNNKSIIGQDVTNCQHQCNHDKMCNILGKNTGNCVYSLDQFQCNCRFGYNGKYCEIESKSSNYIYFWKNSFLKLSNPEILQYISNKHCILDLHVNFMTMRDRGIIYLLKSKNSLKYIMISIYNGHLIYTYQAENVKKYIIVHSQKIIKYEWNSLNIYCKSNHILIRLNNRITKLKIQMNHDIIFYIGGVSSFLQKKLGLKYNQGLCGKMKNFYINNNYTNDKVLNEIKIFNMADTTQNINIV